MLLRLPYYRSAWLPRFLQLKIMGIFKLGLLFAVIVCTRGLQYGNIGSRLGGGYGGYGYAGGEGSGEYGDAPDSISPAWVATVAGWQTRQISPTPYRSIARKDGLRISVYTKEGAQLAGFGGYPSAYPSTVDSSSVFYYTPSLLLQPSTAVSYYNNLMQRYEMQFTVVMWNAEYEAAVRDALKADLDPKVKVVVQPLPIEEIRVDAPGMSLTGVQILNDWTLYGDQPSFFTFGFVCTKNDTCGQRAENMRNYPDDFVQQLVVSYSFTVRKSTQKTISVKSGHVQAGKLYRRIRETIPEEDTVYLQSDDLDRLTMETAKIIMKEQAIEGEFVEQDQASKISDAVGRLSQKQVVSSQSFQEGTFHDEPVFSDLRNNSTRSVDKRWDLVYWEPITSRPDRIAGGLNELVQKQSAQTRLRIKGAALGRQNASLSCLEFSSQDDCQTFRSLSEQARTKCSWNESKFVAKSMALYRVSLGGQGSEIKVTVSVSKNTGDLERRLNLALPERSPLSSDPLPVPAPASSVSNATETKCPRYVFSAEQRSENHCVATDQCRLQRYVGLAVPKTEATWKCLLEAVKKEQQKRQLGDFWLGLQNVSGGRWDDGDSLQESHYISWDLKDLVSSPWSQPSMTECAAVRISDLRWVYRPCEKKLPYVCEDSGYFAQSSSRGHTCQFKV